MTKLEQFKLIGSVIDIITERIDGQMDEEEELAKANNYLYEIYLALEGEIAGVQ